MYIPPIFTCMQYLTFSGSIPIYPRKATKTAKERITAKLAKTIPRHPVNQGFLAALLILLVYTSIFGTFRSSGSSGKTLSGKAVSYQAQIVLKQQNTDNKKVPYEL